jgi:ribosomal small subunit protein bTHX
MGRGDRRTEKGKRFKKSFGKKRPRKDKAAAKAA